jgi:hypothetical protein
VAVESTISLTALSIPSSLNIEEVAAVFDADAVGGGIEADDLGGPLLEFTMSVTPT